MGPVDQPGTPFRAGQSSNGYFPHVHADEVSSSSPPSSPSDRGQPTSRRQTPTGQTYAQFLGRGKGKSRAYHASSSIPYAEPDHPRRPREAKSQSRAQSQSASASSRRLDSLLLLATERIASESTRASGAEAQLRATMALLRTARAERDQALASVAALRTQLTLYQDQLARAQSEITRAQEIVEGVERSKVEALEDAARARSRVRRLEEERVVKEAVEEGRRRGFRDGLQRGRMMARAAGWNDEYDSDYGEDDDDHVESRRPEPPPTRTTEPAIQRSDTRGPPQQVDVAPHAEPLPIPTLTTPAPLNVPSTQPQSWVHPPSEASVSSRQHGPTHGASRTRSRSGSQPQPDTSEPSRATSRPRAQSYLTSTPVPAPSRSPESIRPIPPVPLIPPVRPIPSSANPPDQEPVHLTDQLRARARETMASPTPSRRSLGGSMAYPPDGWIPTLDSESAFISLPPPHEFSQTPHTIDGRLDLISSPPDEVQALRATEDDRVRNRDKGKEIDRERRRAGRRVGGTSGRYPPPHAGTMSTASLSQYDILSPPNTGSRVGESSRRGDEGVDRHFADMQDEYLRRQQELAMRSPKTPTPAPGIPMDPRANDRMVNEWQAQSQEVMQPPPQQVQSSSSRRKPVPVRSFIRFYYPYIPSYRVFNPTSLLFTPLLWLALSLLLSFSAEPTFCRVFSFCTYSTASTRAISTRWTTMSVQAALVSIPATVLLKTQAWDECLVGPAGLEKSSCRSRFPSAPSPNPTLGQAIRSITTVIHQQ
ncbi:hypothetical protein HGRIS_013896 [Hohenbuehelia grisea]|uniref:Uncharacterized protein n=1 Tax=Hohenbuehelia grisea TaxID=104357 RepID=A0ABR3IX60_9AGAR